ncbi:GcrA cell cycle regulator [Paroceanicella profunda]|uniref:GcrA cell cycle regulator n=1 Tax=Paroceanicella profunda TaxID=2579971 RepID=A0A5B8G0F9_9RHOB|nr:GcrA family cell cycle regulator [Paroceanicella profunda]QDL91953.1 GcrA cell cycle regulator [Paroceanicella profunda]
MSWTDERVEELKTMWNEGKSASQIAKTLGGVTRNAVIGKVHRLGLSNRTAGAAKDEVKPAAAAAPEPPLRAVPEPKEEAAEAAPAERVVPREAPRRPVPVSQPVPPTPPMAEVSPEALANLTEIEKRARKLDLMQLTERTCKWPIGDPATEEFWFCGLPATPGKPYCDAHVAVAFQPMSSRRDRRSGSGGR